VKRDDLLGFQQIIVNRQMIPLIVFGMALMMAIEAAATGRSWPRDAGWRRPVIVFNSIKAAMVWLAGVAWDWRMMRRRPWSMVSALRAAQSSDTWRSF
jgi:hypothetical protein